MSVDRETKELLKDIKVVLVLIAKQNQTLIDRAIKENRKEQ